MSKRKSLRGVQPVYAGVVLLAGLSGCIAAKKQAAGEGIARLTVRNLGAVIGLLNADTACGFASDAVQGAAVVTGNPGEDGSVVFTVAGCTVTAANVEDTDCNGVTKTSSGSFTADATLTITGLVTGDPNQPVVPNSPESITFDFSNISFSEFKVVDSGNENNLTQRSGSISMTAKPRLAVAEDSGACAIATPNVTFTDITYSADSVVFLSAINDKGKLKEKEIEIGGGTFSAQNGVGPTGEENTISGNLITLGKDAPVDGDGKLDPDYDAAAFQSDYACEDNLVIPESFDCADVRQVVAENSGRLSALTLGIAAGVARAQCPFVPAGLTGGLGEDGSVLTLALAAECPLTFPAGTVVSTDCNGETITIEGSYTVAAGSTLEVTGYNVGNAAVGVLPTSRAPAVITASIDFTNFSISKSVADPAVPAAVFSIASGNLSGEVAPRFFLDPASGACTISSDILGTAPVAFNNVTWTDAVIELDSDDLVDDNTLFNFTLDTSSIDAQSGDNVATSNEINGSLTFSGVPITIAPGTLLQEDFDAQVFEDAFRSCPIDADNGIPNAALAVADAQCSFRQALGQNAARLMVGATAGVVTVKEAACGPATATVFNGAPNTVGNSVATTTNCTIPFPAGAPASLDCTGGAVDVDGTFTFNGAKTTTGFMVDLNADGNVDVVAPVAQDGASFDNAAIDMAAWSFDKLANGVSLAKITVTGDIEVSNFTPILAEGDGNLQGNPDGVGDGTFTQRSPIFSFDGLASAAGATITATLVLRNAAGLLTFNIDITNLGINAFVGAIIGTSNDIDGALTVDGELVTIVAGTPFDAAFNQAALDASYSCVNLDDDPLVAATLTNNLILVPAQ